MNYTEVYSEVVAEGFSHETALAVNLGLLILVSKKIKNRHMKQSGLFWSEAQKEMRDAFFLTEKFTREVIDEAIAIVEAWHVYSLGKACGGESGCVQHTIRECIAMNAKKEE